MNNLVEAALSYAAKGYLVFPCKPRSKEPATRHGFKDATTDPESIRKWWLENPNYNVAYRTGLESEILVLDIDGVEGESTLAEWREESKVIPRTPTVNTPNGLHVYLRHPGSRIGNRVKSVPGIDVREEGGYVLAPPSEHPSGEVYEWRYGFEDVDVADCPLWLLQALTERPSGRREPTKWAKVLEGVPEGQRDNHLWEVAWRAAHAGIPQEWAERLAVEAADNCTPPFSKSVALEKVRRAYATTMAQPPSAPSQDKEGDTLSGRVLMADAMENGVAAPEVFEPGFLLKGMTHHVYARQDHGKIGLPCG